MQDDFWTFAESELDLWCSKADLTEQRPICSENHIEQLSDAQKQIASLETRLREADRLLLKEQRLCLVVKENYNTLMLQYDALLSLYKQAMPHQFQPGVTVPPFDTSDSIDHHHRQSANFVKQEDYQTPKMQRESESMMDDRESRLGRRGLKRKLFQ